MIATCVCVEVNEMTWMCGVTNKDRISNRHVRGMEISERKVALHGSKIQHRLKADVSPHLKRRDYVNVQRRLSCSIPKIVMLATMTPGTNRLDLKLHVASENHGRPYHKGVGN